MAATRYSHAAAVRALEVGETYVRAERLGGDMTVDDINEVLSESKEALRNAVNASIRSASAEHKKAVYAVEVSESLSKYGVLVMAFVHRLS